MRWKTKNEGFWFSSKKKDPFKEGKKVELVDRVYKVSSKNTWTSKQQTRNDRSRSSSSRSFHGDYNIGLQSADTSATTTLRNNCYSSSRSGDRSMSSVVSSLMTPPSSIYIAESWNLAAAEVLSDDGGTESVIHPPCYYQLNPNRNGTSQDTDTTGTESVVRSPCHMPSECRKQQKMSTLKAPDQHHGGAYSNNMFSCTSPSIYSDAMEEGEIVFQHFEENEEEDEIIFEHPDESTLYHHEQNEDILDFYVCNEVTNSSLNYRDNLLFDEKEQHYDIIDHVFEGIEKTFFGVEHHTNCLQHQSNRKLLPTSLSATNNKNENITNGRDMTLEEFNDDNALEGRQNAASSKNDDQLALTHSNYNDRGGSSSTLNEKSDMLDIVFEGIENFACQDDNFDHERMVEVIWGKPKCEGSNHDFQDATLNKEIDILDHVFGGVEKFACRDDYDRIEEVINFRPTNEGNHDVLDHVFEGIENFACRDDYHESLDERIKEAIRNRTARTIPPTDHQGAIEVGANENKLAIGDTDALEYVCNKFEHALGISSSITVPTQIITNWKSGDDVPDKACQESDVEEFIHDTKNSAFSEFLYDDKKSVCILDPVVVHDYEKYDTLTIIEREGTDSSSSSSSMSGTDILFVDEENLEPIVCHYGTMEDTFLDDNASDHRPIIKSTNDDEEESTVTTDSFIWTRQTRKSKSPKPIWKRQTKCKKQHRKRGEGSSKKLWIKRLFSHTKKRMGANNTGKQTRVIKRFSNGVANLFLRRSKTSTKASF